MAIVRTTTTGDMPDPKKPTTGKTVARPTTARPASPVKSGESGQFLGEIQTELRRVVWPSREDVRAGTIVTIGMLVFFAIYISGLDAIMQWLFSTLFNTPSK